MDQNEKLQCFGCTHVAMIDGCSRMVCGFGTMQMKNPGVIYNEIFTLTLAKYCVWNQLRIDRGKEFVLTIFVQELIASYYYCRIKLLGNKLPRQTMTLLKDSGPK